MTRLLRGSFAAFVVIFLLAADAMAQNRFAGTWDTTYGRMYLFQTNAQVIGFYDAHDTYCKVEGTVDKTRWTFKYHEPTVSGEGYFDLSSDGHAMSGQWRPEGTEAWQPWSGHRVLGHASSVSFAGVWRTSFGKLRLLTERDAVRGCYATPYGATVDGKLTGRNFHFKYHEPNAEGDGWFELAKDGRAIRGLWRAAGTQPWLDWFGVRVEPVPGQAWLVVVEAHWERDIAEPEYSFGSMLRAFFARIPKVQVRQRFFGNEDDLARACHEVTYLPEPVVLCIASHGSGEGVSVNGQTIGPAAFAESLRYARSVKLLHFSSCSVMHDKLPEAIMAAHEPASRFAISGYRESADWAGSVVLEFLYFDMILSRGQSPSQAAGQVRLLVPFASEKPIEGSLVSPMGFRLLLPQGR
jgi:hypothetical protein